MGTNTGIGIGIGIPFRNNALGGDNMYFPPELKARMIGVWDNYGKKNTDADRNIIKNKIPNAGGDLEILNSAYKLNSGFGKYEVDFTSWIQTDGVIASSDKVQNSIVGRFLYFNTVNKKEDVPSFKVNITLGQQSKLQYNYIKEDGTSTYIVYSESGIYTIPASYFSKYTGGNAWFGFYQIEGTSIIEQIPSFEGALVTDGINDIIASIKTLEEWNIGDKGITIVSMIHQINTNSNNFITTNNIRTDNKVVGRNIVSNIEKTGIYGWYKENIQSDTTNVINNILGDKNDYISHSSSSTNINPINNSKFYVQGYAVENGFVEISSIAHYWTFALLGKATEDDINLIIAYFNLDRTLKPDILCNTIKQGITNENHAEFGDKLIDFSGNGRDIQLNNIAWKLDSGIGKYETDLSDTRIWTRSKEITSSPFSFSYNGLSGWILFANTELTNSTDIPSFKIQIKGLLEGQELIYRYYDSNGQSNVYSMGKDGEYTLPSDVRTAKPQTSNTSGFQVVKNEANIITITQIPSHAGALCLDGVNDFGKVTGMPIYKDYTIVVDYERISGIEQAWAEALISKSYIANQGAFVLMETNGTAKHSYSFGAYATFNKDDSTRTLLYQSKYKCGDVNLNAGTGIDGDTLWLGTYRDNYSSFFNGAIYSLMTFPYSMSEFLIERQLKKHKLGTLYPDMVEFRPVIKTNTEWKYLEIYQGDNRLYNLSEHDDKTGIYLEENSSIGIYVKPYTGQKVSKIVYNGTSYIDLENNDYGYYYITVPVTKSPQKIGITIEQDENYVLFNPVINSNVEYHKLDFYLNNYQKRINIGDYIPKGAYLSANFYLKNNVDELTVFTFNGVNIGYEKSSVDDTAFNIGYIYNYDSPQEVNITIDEYIRFEDIVQPYPVLLRFKDENGNEVSWGGKFRVGSTITRIGSIADPESNLLNGLYSINGLTLNGKNVTSSTHIVEKQMVFKTTATYLLDNNEPKVILSPRLLRIPNSSYKILGHIPDISGHGNHGVIHNSAYTEGSGVNEDGSYQFNGVDDFVTIPTLSRGGKQVLMKVNWNTINSIIYDQRGSGGFAIYCSDYNNPSDSITVPAYKGRNPDGTTYIDGIRNEYIIASQLRNVTHNIVEILDTSYAAGNINPIIGKSCMNSNYGSLALYDFMLFDNISTDDKIKELNEYVGIEAKIELPPYYWDAYGKTNLDGDKATIQQRGVAVGDYDLTNYNHAYEGMSGYNGYPVVFGANKTWEQMPTGTFTWNIDDNKLHITKALIAGNGLLFSYVKLNGSLLNVKEIPSFKIKVSGLEGKSKLWYRYLKTEDAISETTAVLENGTHELPKSYTPSDSLHDGVWIGFTVSPISEGVKEFDCDITIEVLPEYENGLVYDGITDYSKNANIPALDDFTAIIKREWLKKQGCPLIKGSKVYEGGNGNALLLEWDKAYNFVFYKRTDIMEGELPDNISFITPTNYNGNVITRGSEQDTNGICIAGDGNAGFANMVFYKLILYPKTIPLLQINFLKNLMEKDEIIDLNNPIFIKDE